MTPKNSTIPGTDLRVSPICLGTALFGATIDTPTAYELLDGFMEQGGTFIDTARMYNDWIPGARGRSETLIGRWLADRRSRQHMVLATKGGHANLETGAPRLNAQDIAEDVNASLGQIGVDVIDLYYLHRDDPGAPVEPLVDALNTHVRAGKIRYLGCSNWTADRIGAANTYAAASGQMGFVANQPMWNAAVVDPATLADRTVVVMDAGMRSLHAETGLACVPFSAQAGGLFSKLRSPLWSLAFRFGRGPAGYPPGPNRRRYAALARIAASKSLTMTQVVLGYLLSQPFVTVPVVGCRTLNQLRGTMSACDVRLTPAELAAIDAAA